MQSVFMVLVLISVLLILSSYKFYIRINTVKVRVSVDALQWYSQDLYKMSGRGKHFTD